MLIFPVNMVKSLLYWAPNDAATMNNLYGGGSFALQPECTIGTHTATQPVQIRHERTPHFLIILISALLMMTDVCDSGTESLVSPR